jgi:steroid delta-isomerase-like uncharacterized protein
MFERKKDIPRRLLEEAFNAGHLDVVDELVAENAVDHDPQNPNAGVRGPEGVRTMLGTYRAAFPDLHLEIQEQLSDGDYVVTRWRSSGTHQGDLFGIPATGRHGTVTGITIDRIANGKIAESWTNWDTLGLLQQVGAIPAMQTPA